MQVPRTDLRCDQWLPHSVNKDKWETVQHFQEIRDATNKEDQLPPCNTWGLLQFFQQSNLMPEDDLAVQGARIVAHRAAATELKVFDGLKNSLQYAWKLLLALLTLDECMAWSPT